MMFSDSEVNQLHHLHSIYQMTEPLLFNGNSFEKKICKCINKFNELTNNSGHNALPPDFYSDELNIMFDIYRVNDSEIKKSYNPTAIAERKMEQEVRDSWIAEVCPQAVDNLICIDENWGSDKIHKMQYYIKNIKRVANDHLSSSVHPNKIKDIWMHEHPNITRKGLVVYDETENYFQGEAIYNPLVNQWQYLIDATKPVRLYQPWMDGNILNQIYDSDCDFLIWFMPYKWCELLSEFKIDFPQIIIMDTRFPRTDFIEYDYSKFTRT